MAGELQEALVAAAQAGKKPAEVVDFNRVPVKVRSALTELLSGLAETARQIPSKTSRAPALALLSADARRFGKAGEIFGKAGFFGPAASQLTYGLRTPEEEVPPITFPTEFLEKCREAGGQLRLFTNKTPGGEPLTMAAMYCLVAARWKREGKGTLLYNDVHGLKAAETFFNDETPRPGWRIVFPHVVQGTLGKDDLVQTELLLAQLNALFHDMPLPQLYERAIIGFERKKPRVLSQMENEYEWAKASKSIENSALNRLIRPTPPEVLDHMAVALDGMDQKLFEDVYTRLPRRSSSGSLVSVGDRDLNGARVDNDYPGDTYPNVGASLSLQPWQN